MPDDTFEIIFLAGFVTGSLIRVVYTRHDRRRRIARSAQTVADLLLIALASLGLCVAPFACLFTPWLDFADYPAPAWIGWAGAAVFPVALWLLWRSHVDLGRHWSARLEIREDHALVTDGVYARIRHPMYAAHALWGVAQALLLRNWIGGPALLVFFLPLYLVRVPREERMMLERFGDAYRSYVARTGRLLPRRRA